MSFGLRDVLDKNVLHQLQLGIWGLSYIYTTAVRIEPKIMSLALSLSFPVSRSHSLSLALSLSLSLAEQTQIFMHPMNCCTPRIHFQHTCGEQSSSDETPDTKTKS